MNKAFLAGLFIICINYEISYAQTVDLTSVDEFFKVALSLKEGKEISGEQWKDFDNSSGYKEFALREDQAFINTIKASVKLAFGDGTADERDRILRFSQEEMLENTSMLLNKQILNNLIDVNNHFDSIQSFRDNYDFETLVDKAKERLCSFLQLQAGPAVVLKPVYFFFALADGAVKDDALYIDFNLIYKQSNEQRINFLAHEYFHNLREKYENHDFNSLLSGRNLIMDLEITSGELPLVGSSLHDVTLRKTMF